MKLRNKKTGDIGYLIVGRGSAYYHVCDDGWSSCGKYWSLAELNEEWEDAPEEPKVGYIIDPMDEDYISADNSGYEESNIERAKELGIWLETEEEAKKAVEKLKAWKRLKDKGFRFACYTRRSDWAGLSEVKALENLIDITAYLPKDKIEEMKADLDLLFGGEE